MTGKEKLQQLKDIASKSIIKPFDSISEEEKYAEYVTGIVHGYWRGGGISYNLPFSEDDVARALEKAEQYGKKIKVVHTLPKDAFELAIFYSCLDREDLEIKLID